ncbi:unnamed protein product, partial [Chrysoparadoxa australica]
FRKRNKELWGATETWSEQWEIKFAQWIKDNVKEDFFSKYNISTDCADAILGIRWIFSRIHGLPVANHISTTSSLFTNYSVPKKWRYLDKADQWHQDELFLTALNYVMKLASTRTIKLDSYPVALTKQGLRIGSFLLTESVESNHVKLISENNFDDPTDLPIFTLASTVPRQVRLLVREVVTDQGWPKEGEKSFLKFRWPIVSDKEVYLKSEASHVDYSREQFSEDLRDQYPVFIQFLLGRLKDAYDPSNLITLALEDILEYTQQRIQVVADGAAFCEMNDCSPGTANWDAWSTPSRDKKLKDKFANIDLLTTQFENLSPGLVERWQRAQAGTKVAILSFNLSLKTIRYLLENGYASSEPSDTVEKRWGIDIEGTATELVEALKQKLGDRKTTIRSQWQDCLPADCFPKTAKWLSWNTFKIDEDLLKIVTDINELCQIYGEDVCYDLIFDDSVTFDSGTEVLSLREWMERIPLFYSNLDVSLERRWGKLAPEEQVVSIDYLNTVEFSKDSLALIDGRVLIDLVKNETILEADLASTLTLSDNGEVLLFSPESKKLKVGVRDEFNQFTFKELATLNFDGTFVAKVTSFSSSPNLKAIEFKTEDQRTSYIAIFDGSGNLLSPPSLSTKKDDLILNSETGTLTSLMLDMEFDLLKDLRKIVIGGRAIDLTKLTPIAIEKDKRTFLFNYRDENYGVSYPILLIEGESTILGFDQTKNVTIEAFSLEQGVFFVNHLINEEYPKAYILTKTASGLSETLVGNSFSQVIQVNETFYYSTLTGSAWDQSRVPSFRKLKNGQSTEVGSLNGKKVSHFGKKGIFLNGADVYTAGDYRGFVDSESLNKAYPSFTRSQADLCSNIQKKSEFYAEQFSYQHGDFNCFATIYEDEEKAKPVFTQKFRDSSNTFKDLSGIENQTLEVIGKRKLLWWGKKYNITD